MGLITPDFTEVTGEIPTGVYAARIKNCETKIAQTSGNPYLNWTLELFGNPTVNNRMVFLSTPVTGKGAFRLQELYKAAIGEPLSDKQAFDTDSLISKEITVTLVPGKDKDGNARSFPDVKTVTAYKQ